MNCLITKYKNYILLSIFLLIMLLMSGCGSSADNAGQNDSSSKNVPTETRTINHAMGTTVITGTPERVVVLFNGMVDISLALDVKPVGAVESWLEKPWYVYLRNSMVGVKNLGLETQPNLEAVAALKPDLIIGSKARHEKIYDQLSRIAPTVMTESVFDWKTNLEIAGQALNKEAEATAFMEDWDSGVAEFKEKMGDKLATEVSLIRFEPGGAARIWYTSGFPGLILDEIGLQRPESQRGREQSVLTITDKEQIPLMDGDIIFDVTADFNGDGDVFKTKQEWLENPLWKNLEAVKKGKVYDVNEITWNMSGGAMAAKKMLEDLYFYFEIEK